MSIQQSRINLIYIINYFNGQGLWSLLGNKPTFIPLKTDLS